METELFIRAIDIRTLGSLSRDDLRKICGDNYPEWISFPVYEQAKWLNKQLSKLWPFVAEAASAVIKESIEPILEEYRPTGVNSLKFSKLSLGTVAPKIEGINLQIFLGSVKKCQVTMDIDFRWGGDPNIVIEVDTPAASIPIQLKDFQFFSNVRIIFQLTVEMPCISALVVALLSEALDDNVKLKLSPFCHVPAKNTVTLYDVPNIWHIPLLLRDQKAHEAILK
ncbi:Detected protein of confused Function [Hibiscus syriacus]|uniref:Detected protein of confused Function n=1 Tax=Hibiscus syriacus TaxID=106335 RepID=A0A6A2XRQ6_HIBSY|nr:Detected protein of confused Function [Hibiscus syriacus]